VTAALLDRLLAGKIITPLDRRFALMIGRLFGDEAWVMLAAALASREVTDRGVCLDLAGFLAAPPEKLDPADLPPTAGAWAAVLADADPVVGDGLRPTPLVLDAGRLYLHRLWRAEVDLADRLLAMAREVPGIDDGLLAAGLERLFPPDDGDQARAAETAVRRGLAIISGGPGTGKTFTVSRVLALLVEQAAWSGAGRPRIALAAPTGKAASRLQETINAQRHGLGLESAHLEGIPAEASTIHRLLGAGHGSYRHDPGNPLPVDVLVVDEASMVDLPLMSRLVAALPAGARLILLGDRDQLASVEAGRVLGDICAVTEAGGPLAPCIAVLERNRRAAEAPDIGMFARAVNQADPDGAMAILAAGGGQVSRADLPAGRLGREELSRIAGRFEPYRELVAGNATPGETLDALNRFRVLCALSIGPLGAERVNRRIEEALGFDFSDPAYRGRPVMVTENDYGLGLFNGDTGVILPDASAGGEPRAFFREPSGNLRKIAPPLLPPHQTCFALTVHKAQGSEFDRVTVILGGENRLLTRELLYTAVTRARQEVEILGGEPALAAACRRVTERSSGLRDRLWKPVPSTRPPTTEGARE
jgi:exodeoxyribonuclease V alpha subunit